MTFTDACANGLPRRDIPRSLVADSCGVGLKSVRSRSVVVVVVVWSWVFPARRVINRKIIDRANYLDATTNLEERDDDDYRECAISNANDIHSFAGSGLTTLEAHIRIAPVSHSRRLIFNPVSTAHTWLRVRRYSRARIALYIFERIIDRNWSVVITCTFHVIYIITVWFPNTLWHLNTHVP